MAKLTREDVLKLAKLAKLSLTNEEVDSFTKEISEILNYVEQLQAVDINATQPTYQVTGLTNVTRADVIKDYQADPQELLKNVPQREGNLIKVKRVLQ